jgi:hypothetical protein
MKLFFSLIALFVSNSAFSIVNDSVKYVWAVNGLNIRSAPNIQGKIIKKISFGDSVLLLTTTGLKHKVVFMDSMYEYNRMLYLTGHWVKIKSGQTEGYAFDSYLLSVPCAREREALNDFAIRMSERFSQTTIADSFRITQGGNYGMMQINSRVCNFPQGQNISFYLPSEIKLPEPDTQQIDHYEGSSAGFYFKGFSLQELLVFIAPFYLSDPDHVFRIFQNDSDNLRMSDGGIQTIDLWPFKKEIFIMIFEDAGC